MFGKFGDIKKKAGQMKERLAETVIEKEEAGIKVIINGTKDITSIHIPELYLETGRKEELEQKLMEVINNAGADANEVMKKEMSALAGPLGGMLGL
jgi:DNA-binding protein YbaB